MRNCDNMSAAIRLPHIATPEPCALSPVTRWPPCAFLARYHVIGAAGLQPNLRRSHWASRARSHSSPRWMERSGRVTCSLHRGLNNPRCGPCRWRASLAASAHPRSDAFRRSHRLRRGGFLPRRFVHVRFGHADGLRWWLGRGPTQMVVLETHPASGRLVAPGNVELVERTSRSAKWPFGVIGNPQINFKQISTPARYHPRII
jgi:hypothetical protein